MASQRSSKPEAELSSPPPASKKQRLAAAAAARASPFQCLAPARGCERELPHEQLARQQEAAMCLAMLTPLPPLPMLSQEARDEAPAISLALGTSLPLRAHDIDNTALNSASDGPPHMPGHHTA
ncbi:hypothetical protein B0H14DRAFT_3480102 [Mycena olivaceomarginata]|nr:hypothetical protein B0H14DRAFT_3480102 [Mycena olivaceomarginata]